MKFQDPSFLTHVLIDLSSCILGIFVVLEKCVLGFLWQFRYAFVYDEKVAVFLHDGIDIVCNFVCPTATIAIL